MEILKNDYTIFFALCLALALFVFLIYSLAVFILDKITEAVIENRPRKTIKEPYIDEEKDFEKEHYDKTIEAAAYSLMNFKTVRLREHWDREHDVHVKSQDIQDKLIEIMVKDLKDRIVIDSKPIPKGSTTIDIRLKCRLEQHEETLKKAI